MLEEQRDAAFYRDVCNEESAITGSWDAGLRWIGRLAGCRVEGRKEDKRGASLATTMKEASRQTCLVEGSSSEHGVRRKAQCTGILCNPFLQPLCNQVAHQRRTISTVL